ncbi:transcription elongation factor SPT5 [Striga asiatica]|uniref:Transcription elongation factor SPT5 n=1 Tax=Striga asiatica TaxID=4170 RepID=A0A5A7P2J2_STRAF|nr:transcription elongation factor SPT5 [Striga asiatica]
MAATGSCRTTSFFPLSAPKSPHPPHKFSPSPKHFHLCSHRCSNPSLGVSHSHISPPPAHSSNLHSPAMGCKACGREDIERGCNGEGRIQGGIATIPGFGWWPIKAYRPCPAYVASGGRYRRTGQSMDEVVSGKVKRGTSGGALWAEKVLIISFVNDGASNVALEKLNTRKKNLKDEGNWIRSFVCLDLKKVISNEYYWEMLKHSVISSTWLSYM